MALLPGLKNSFWKDDPTGATVVVILAYTNVAIYSILLLLAL